MGGSVSHLNRDRYASQCQGQAVLLAFNLSSHTFRSDQQLLRRRVMVGKRHTRVGRRQSFDGEVRRQKRYPGEIIRRLWDLTLRIVVQAVRLYTPCGDGKVLSRDAMYETSSSKLTNLLLSVM